MEDTGEADETGVSVALEKICSLESRLRQAIQGTHSLHRSFGRDMGAVDREREALLLIREHLELLEDKLREFRTMAMDPKGYDDKAVTLSQLDGLRKDLLRAARDRVDYVLYNKDVVKDILAFADTGGGGEESAPDKTVDADSPRGNYSPQPLSPVLSSEENDFFSADQRENGYSYGHASDASSPFGPKKHLHVRVDDFQENRFPYPGPGSTPSTRAPQTRESTEALEMNIGLGTPPRAAGRRGTAFSNTSRNNGKYGRDRRAPSTGAPYESLTTSYGDYDQPFRPPSSNVGSSHTPAEDPYGGSKTGAYHRDPSYGGKVNLATFKGRDLGQNVKQQPPPPPSSATSSDHPKIVHDSTYADEQTRKILESEIQHGDVSSPIRTAMQRRLAATVSSKPSIKPERGRQIFGFLGSCIKIALFGSVSAVAAVTFASVLQKPRHIPLPSLPRPQLPRPQLPRPQKRRATDPPAQPVLDRPKTRPPSSPGLPRADGHLVPDWMHKSQFKSSEWPPTGTLTSTEQPPGGEMFPVIPPPTSKHVKG